MAVAGQQTALGDQPFWRRKPNNPLHKRMSGSAQTHSSPGFEKVVVSERSVLRAVGTWQVTFALGRTTSSPSSPEYCTRTWPPTSPPDRVRLWVRVASPFRSCFEKAASQGMRAR